MGDTMDAMRIGIPLTHGPALPLVRPVVFLESTVVAQGLPWPENLETALAMIIREPPEGREHRARTHASG